MFKSHKCNYSTTSCCCSSSSSSSSNSSSSSSSSCSCNKNNRCLDKKIFKKCCIYTEPIIVKIPCEPLSLNKKAKCKCKDYSLKKEKVVINISCNFHDYCKKRFISFL